MLVLSRKKGEKLFIGENICITVVEVGSGKVRLGIEAPKDVPVTRPDAKKSAPEDAATSGTSNSKMS